MERVNKMRDFAATNLSKSILRQPASYHRQAKSFAVGQSVMLFTPLLDGASSNNIYTSRWSGPHIIVQLLNKLTLSLRLAS